MMKRIVFVTIALAATAAATTPSVGAQEPPVPPTPPSRPTTPRAPRAIVPLSPMEPLPALAPLPPMEAMTLDIDRLRDRSLDITEASRALARIDMTDMREAERAAARASRAFDRDAAEQVRAAMEAARDGMEAARDGMEEARDRMRPPRFAPLQGEPEDSLYRMARDVLNRGDYGRAAQMFKDIAQKYPRSVYASDFPYYEAWARYKIGTTDELRTAAKLLEPRASKLTGNFGASGNSVYISNRRRGTSDGDVVTLYARINSVLASRGDHDAAAIVEKLAQAGSNVCDREDMQVRTEAMSALTQVDPATALPVLRRVLEKKDECTAELRKRAVFILGRRGDADAASLIAATAKSDPSQSVRIEAINWLPRLQGDAGVAALEDLLRTETDEDIQRSIVRTLVSSDNPKARSSMRALIDRKDASVRLRVAAIGGFDNDRATAEDGAYLRGVYARTDDEPVRSAIIDAVSHIGGPENEQWILALARNPKESSQARATAISRLVRSNVAIGELTKLYDAADSYNVRRQIVGVLARRKEPEATNKLIEIVKNGTVTSLRTQAIDALRRKDDPRATQLLLDIVSGQPKTP